LFPGIHRKLAHEVSLKGGPGGNITVELHWGIIAGDKDQRSPDLGYFWEQTKGWRTGEHALMLSPTLTILYSSAHQILQHGNEPVRLIWLYDVQQLLRCKRDCLDYDQLLDQADQLNWSTPLLTTLKGIRERFGTPMENVFFDKPAISEAASVKNFAGRKPRLGQTRSEIILERMTYLDLSSRLLWVLAKIFPTPDHMRWHYNPRPTWLWPFFYPYRWFDISTDILKTGARAVGGLIAGDDRSKRFEEKDN
jgi:hypothetical protein